MILEEELETEEQQLELTCWVWEEVYDDFQYLNINLIRYPFHIWKGD